MQLNATLRSVLFSACMLALAYLSSLIVQDVLNTQGLSAAIFVLFIHFIALYTKGYLYGIVSSLVGMILVNYAFTTPYYTINFSIPQNILAAFLMITCATLTCMLTTRLKQQEQIRREADREMMRANLLRAVSHDLRTPLTTIYGSSSAILENYDTFSDEQKKKLIQGIQEDTDWLNRMVENLLSVTRIGSQEVKIIKTPIVLDELIDSVVVKFRKRYPNQPLQLSLPTEIVIIPMDVTLIEQVINNILENAVLHAEGMTTLTLSVNVEENSAVFTIADDGCGIDQDRIASLFTGQYPEKLSDADRHRHNAGIGLSVCATIIHAHGGEIYAENRHPGAAFHFTLQLEEDEDEQQSLQDPDH